MTSHTRLGFESSTPGASAPDVTVVTVGVNLGDADLVRAQNQAYAKFQDSVKASAQNANNLLEVGQNVSSVTQKVTAVHTAYKAVKRGDFAGVAKALGLSNTGNIERRIKKRAMQASDAWLEYHFGWEPLVKDIGASIDIISPPPGSASSKGGKKASGSAAVNGSDYANNSRQLDPYYYKTDIQHRSWICGCRMRGHVYVDNPNLAIANQMGFVNPLSVAWEAVPFSFVVDWFANVGQVLGACTDDFGYQIVNSSGTNFQKSTISTVQGIDGPPNRDDDSYAANSAMVVRVGRSEGIVSPRFIVTLPKAVSVARGATAISLLVQSFLSPHKGV